MWLLKMATIQAVSPWNWPYKGDIPHIVAGYQIKYMHVVHQKEQQYRWC
jgi:hypothetical protein